MADIRNFTVICDYGYCMCDSTAEVFNRYNQSCGHYCREHALLKLEEVLAEEKAEEERAWKEAGF